jgi:hypothetical protein
MQPDPAELEKMSNQELGEKIRLMKEKIANIQNSSQARGTWGNQGHNDNN